MEAARTAASALDSTFNLYMSTWPRGCGVPRTRARCGAVKRFYAIRPLVFTQGYGNRVYVEYIPPHINRKSLLQSTSSPVHVAGAC